MARDRVFICHATPEDNDFVHWLGTRLIGHGYRVWADLFELKGGTPFWISIEEALRQRAIKFIYVVSKTSVDARRSGVRNELSVADAMRKTLSDPSFIIPIRIDDTNFADFPIQIHQQNAIDFSKGWGGKLVELLDTLRDANVPRSSGDPTPEFEMWRASMVRTAAIVADRPEPVLTNLVPVIRLPSQIGFHEYEGDNTKFAAALKETGVPHQMFMRHVIAFAEPSSFQERLSPAFHVKNRAAIPLEEFLDGSTRMVTSPQRDEARNAVTYLLRSHIERHLKARGLKKFDTSSGACFYFPSGLVPKDQISYVAANKRRTYKNVVGRSEKRNVYWHLAMKVNVVLGPQAVIRFKPYICFSEDGKSAITDTKRTSGIRRRFCKSWWNQQWRQLQQAFCAFLANGEATVAIPLDGSETLVLDGRLLELQATRSMPEDLQVVDDPEDPNEPDDDEADFDPDDQLDADDPVSEAA